MTFQQLLHLAVLALSLATVLITLMTYLLFKIRQLPKNSQTQERVFEGRYFRRYVPGQSDPAPNDKDAQIVVEDAPVRQWRTLPVFFVVLTAILFFALAMGHYVIHMPSSKPSIKELTYKEAQAKGLMKEYESNSMAEPIQLKETFSATQLANAENTFRLAKAAHIVLWQTSKSEPLQVWRDFFASHQIAYKSVTSLDGVSGDVLVAPQAKSLSLAQRGQLTAWLKAGHGVLATGPIGLYDEKWVLTNDHFSDDVFSVNFVRNPEVSVRYPTIFAGDRAPWWGLPPGLVLDWQVSDDSFLGSAVGTTEGSAFESTYVARIRSLPNQDDKYIVRSMFTNKDSARRGWLAVDPAAKDSPLKDQRIYADLAIAAALNWCAHLPQAKISDWPSAKHASVVLSVDSEDKFEGALELSSIFQSLGLPGTFFIVSDYLKQDPTLVTTPDEKIEFASHTVDHKILKELELDEQFNEMQQARFDIESYAKKSVDGFRPPEEAFDGVTLAAAVQNKVKYFFGDQHLPRLAPVQIAEGRMVYYPRTVLDDFNLTRFHSFDDAPSLKEALDRELKRVNDLSGGGFYSFHSQLFGQQPMSTWVSEFLKQHAKDPIWFANFRQMTAWWLDRGAISVAITQNQAGFYSIDVQNTGDHPVKDVAVIVDHALDDMTLPAGATNLAPSSDGSTTVLLSNINAGEKLAITFKTASAVVRATASEEEPETKSVATPARTAAQTKKTMLAKKSAKKATKKLKQKSKDSI